MSSQIPRKFVISTCRTLATSASQFVNVIISLSKTTKNVARIPANDQFRCGQLGEYAIYQGGRLTERSSLARAAISAASAYSNELRSEIVMAPPV
jgi:hypothetical protein